MRVDPYLFFNGRCEEAIDFYRRVVGAEVIALARFGDIPGAPTPPGGENKVMHSNLRIGKSTILASDGAGQGKAHFEGFSLSLAVSTDNDAERLFAALGEGGSVRMPLHTSPFASRFGMVADQFGVVWTIATESKSAR